MPDCPKHGSAAPEFRLQTRATTDFDHGTGRIFCSPGVAELLGHVLDGAMTGEVCPTCGEKTPSEAALKMREWRAKREREAVSPPVHRRS